MEREIVQKLIKLGFKPRTLTTIWTQDTYLYKREADLLTEMCHYLYLCEVQYWLRIKHDINIESNRLSNVGKYKYLYIPHNIIPKTFKTSKEYFNATDKYVGKKYYDTYEEALKEGIVEALKLVEKTN